MNPTEKHREFARYLAEGLTVKDSAIKAGFAPTTATTIAGRWVAFTREDSQYPDLWDMVQEIRGSAEKTAGAVADVAELLEFFTGVLRSDVSKTSEFDGYGLKVKTFEEMGESVKYIDQMEYQKGKGVKMKNYSKMDAAKELMKYHGAYEKHNKQKGLPIESLLKVLTDEQLSKLAEFTSPEGAE